MHYPAPESPEDIPLLPMPSGHGAATIKEPTNTPICIGFGITTPEQAAEVASHGDGVIVGSAIVRKVQENADDPEVANILKEFVTPLIEATHSA